MEGARSHGTSIVVRGLENDASGRLVMMCILTDVVVRARRVASKVIETLGPVILCCSMRTPLGKLIVHLWAQSKHGPVIANWLRFNSLPSALHGTAVAPYAYCVQQQFPSRGGRVRSLLLVPQRQPLLVGIAGKAASDVV